MRSFTTVGGLGFAGIAGVGLAFTSLLGCGDPENTTELRPEGPPEVLQLFVVERVQDGAAVRTLPQLAFGSHPDLDEDDDGEVVNAVARSGQRIRIVFDELLRGNDIEEIACADGSWSRVPVGTDPDDIAKCAGSQELLQDCTAVCIGDSGPVGILDENEDGAVDDLRMVDSAVTITCDGTEIPWDQQQSFWQPSGNQQITAGPLGVNSLGPAIVIVPTNGLRTGATCSIGLSADIVDKDGNRPCADDSATYGTGACASGDISALAWTVEGLRVTGTDPSEGATNVAVTSPGSTDANILVQFNAAIDETTIGGITVEDESGAFPACTGAESGCVEATLNANDPTIVTVTVRGGYTPLNMHTVTVATTVTDIFGGALAAAHSFSFETRDSTPVPDAAPMPDADTTDAGIDAMN